MTPLQSAKYYHWEKAFNGGGLFNSLDKQNEIQWIEAEDGQMQSRNKAYFCLKRRKKLAIKRTYKEMHQVSQFLSLKQNLVMLEMTCINGSEIQAPATVSLHTESTIAGL